MPTVPRYRSAQVQTQGLQVPRGQPGAPLEAFGGGRSMAMAQDATNQFLENQARMMAEEKSRADDVASTAALTNLTEAKNRLLYDTEDGAFLKRGENAFGIIDDYGSRLDKEAEAIEKTLHNDTQRGIFSKMRMKISSEFNTALQKHVFQEAKTFDDETVKSGVQVAQNDAVLNFQEPGKIEESLALQETLLRSHAAAYGIPDAAVKMMVDEAKSKTHGGIISRMLNIGDDRLAQAYFDEVKGHLIAEHIMPIEKALEEGSLRGESQRRVDDYFRKGLSAQEAAKEIRKIDDTKLRDAVNTRFKNEHAIREHAEEIDRQNLFNDLADMVEKTGGREDPPLEQWMSLRMNERQALEARRAQLMSGEKPQTNWDLYYGLKVQTPKNELREMNLLVHRHELADTEFKELVNLQKELKSGDESQLDGYRTKAAIVDTALDSIGINPRPGASSGARRRANAFRDAVDQAAAQFARDQGRKPTNDEYRRIAEEMAIEGVLINPDTGRPERGFLWLRQRRGHLFEQEPGRRIRDPEGLELERPALGITEVPRADRLEIERALRNRGRVVTDQAIINLYNDALNWEADQNE